MERPFNKTEALELKRTISEVPRFAHLGDPFQEPGDYVVTQKVIRTRKDPQADQAAEVIRTITDPLYQ